MIEAIRALFAPKRGRDDAQQGEEQAKRRAEIGARAVDSTSAGGAFDGTGDTESAEKRDNGVARGGQGTSGAEPTGGADENPAEEATNTGKGKRKCVLCNRADACRTVNMFFVGALVIDVFQPIFNRYSRIKKKQIGTIDKNQTFRQGDGLCAACSALFEDCVRRWLDWKFELIVDAARKLKIFSAHVRDHLDGKLPRKNDVATLARWDHDDDGERDGVPVGDWWYNLNRSLGQERLKRLRKFDEDSNNALQYLETCVLREDGYAYMNTAHDARKLKIFSAHVRDHLDGKLPRKNDVATLARWDHEDDGERDGVPVGQFWYNLNRSTDKERLKRLRKFDEDSKHALEYLETCEPRKAKALPGRNAK
ncbi:unnamed product [Ostreococcus tauri]|uniref:Unnamed product n=1 Tax=Ostreococcus tauri TaxID=70448 RepID=Q01BP8_OSTTA|nr:unnamed product [Ostreococcus tauri]CAL51398.1 unnamed product [Ostreococcus tauri]|eukprot:XP_003078518.1 unnamed product [Ostreococcus tauri]